MAVVKYGVIGCGAIAQRRHIPEGAANPRSKIAALADPVHGRAAELAAKYGAVAYTDYRKMLKDADLDAVVVCGPNALHAAQTIQALRAGFHVLVEKPMATTRADAKQMIAEAKKARKFLMIGMNQRLMPPHVKAKAVLDQGRLGKVLAFETSFKHPGPDGWSIDGAKSWFFKKDAAVMGVCGDLGVHKADLMRFLLGEEIVKVGGIIKTQDKKTPDGKPIPLDDNAFVVMETASGVMGTMNISWTNYGRFEDNGTTLFCQHGVMRIGIDPQFGVMVDYSDGQKDRYVVGAVATNTRQIASGIIDAFTDSILKNRKPAIDGEEGYRAMNIIVTALDAAKQGKMLKVDLRL
jgi:UDP-N-acetylglucosamine 3-dehydrogenase